jgi:hypothetical protein
MCERLTSPLFSSTHISPSAHSAVTLKAFLYSVPILKIFASADRDQVHEAAPTTAAAAIAEFYVNAPSQQTKKYERDEAALNVISKPPGIVKCCRKTTVAKATYFLSLIVNQYG